MVQIIRIDGQRLVYGDAGKVNLKSEIGRSGLSVRVGGTIPKLTAWARGTDQSPFAW